MSECKLEVGRTYITKDRGKIEVVAKAETPLCTNDNFAVIYSFKNGLQTVCGYREDGGALNQGVYTSDVDWEAMRLVRKLQ